MTEEPRASAAEIGPAGLQQLLEAGGAQLVDVRADHEWAARR